jgi:RHS repeat-associated protein
VGGAGVVMSKDDPNSLALRPVKIVDDQNREVLMEVAGNGAPYMTRYNRTFNAAGNLLAYTQTEYEYNTTSINYYDYTNSTTSAVKTRHFWRTSPTASWQVKNVGRNAYTYNNLNMRTANTVTDATGAVRTETYAYDQLNRLTNVNYGDGQTQGYTFDAMGNRLTKTDNVAGNETYGYNNANMLLNRMVGGTNNAYTNDADGNTLTGGNRTMTWDSANRMVRCVYNGNTNTMTYGADGLRRSMTTSKNGTTTTTKYILDDDKVVQETQATGSNTPVISATYLNGPSGPMYKRPSNAADVRWYAYDGAGNVTGEVDALGNVASEKKHDVYGATRYATGMSTSTHGWQGGVGHQSDSETGLTYMRARYYSTETGRFQSQDSARQGNNWFVYCDNNPTNRVDENGKSWNSFVAFMKALWQSFSDASFHDVRNFTPIGVLVAALIAILAWTGYQDAAAWAGMIAAVITLVIAVGALLTAIVAGAALFGPILLVGLAIFGVAAALHFLLEETMVEGAGGGNQNIFVRED